MIFGNKRIKRIEGQSGSPTWYRFRSFKPALWSLRMLVFLVFISLFADFLANEKPLYCKIDGKHYFPVLQSSENLPKAALQLEWKNLTYERVIWPLIPYSPGTLDMSNSPYANPFGQQRVHSIRFHHWLGTNQIGNDLLAGLIHGTRTALLIGLVAMFIATLIGVSLGGLAGFFGDDKLKVSRAQFVLATSGTILGAFWGFSARSYQFQNGNLVFNLLLGSVIMLGVIGAMLLIAIPIQKLPFFKKRISIPVDLFIMRLIEILNSIPNLMLLLGMIAIVEKPTVFTIMTIIGLITWTGIARFTRAEMLKIRNLDYIQAGRALGFTEWRLLFRHALPNAVGPVLVAIAFGIAGAILAEATLSFIGIGVPVEQVTWGKQLFEARSATSAWWLALFPGLAIFITITIFNLLGEGITEALGKSA